MRTAAAVNRRNWSALHKEAGLDSSSVIGLDIGKTNLVAALADHPTARTFANTPAGHARLVCWARQQHNTLVVLEATGRYHLGIWEALVSAGIGAELVDEGEDVTVVAHEELFQMGGGFGASTSLEGDVLRRAHWLLRRLIYSS